MHRLLTRGIYLLAAFVLVGFGELATANMAQAAYPGPDGRLAYVGYKAVPDDPGSFYEVLYTANPDGSSKRALLSTGDPSGAFYPRHPVWSPDSGMLAYEEQTEAGATINVVNADGSEQRALADGMTPSWTPDGQWVSYSPVGEDNASYKVPVVGGDPEFVIDGADVRWSPDGRHIVFRRGWSDVFVRDLETGEETNLTPDSPDTVDFVGEWAPDGNHVLFTSYGPWPDDGTTFLATADGTTITQFSSTARDLAWSPSGSDLVESHDTDAGTYLRIVNSDGSLDHNTNIEGDEPSWGSAPLGSVADAEPDRCKDVTKSSGKGVWLSGAINEANDSDWYRFRVTRRERVQITLGSLPQDYRLDLYSSCSQLVATSNRSEREYEEVTRVLSEGTYRVRVWGAISSGAPYALRFRELSGKFPILSFRANTGGSGSPGELINNTGTKRTDIKVSLSLYNKNGNVFATAIESLGNTIVEPGGRLSFKLGTPIPDRTARVKVAVTSSQATTASRIGLETSSEPPYSWDSICTPELCPWYFDEDGHVIDVDETLHYDGAVTNTHSFTVRSVRLFATFYDARGGIKDVVVLKREDNAPMASGEVAPWTLSPDWLEPATNRVTFVAAGRR